MIRFLRIAIFVCPLLFAACLFAQQPARPKTVELGSQTAKGGFRNETDIRDKFNNWKTNDDARTWLSVMNYTVSEIESVVASKPHGEKADVEVRIKTKSGERREGISIKLVSSRTGFNQIDKRWVSTYAKMWKMPADVVAALKIFVGETPPVGTMAASPPSSTHGPKRMYLNELEPTMQKAVVNFFTRNKDEIVSDLFAGDGVHDADWVMVALRAGGISRWIIRSSADAIRFFSDGPVEITRNGNLKIGRITMQRKGGDAGRNTAKMLQFKINPALLFDAK